MLVAVEIFTLMSETEVEVKNCGWGGSVGSKHCPKRQKWIKILYSPFSTLMDLGKTKLYPAAAILAMSQSP